jgi:hypothetical protein
MENSLRKSSKDGSHQQTEKGAQPSTGSNISKKFRLFNKTNYLIAINLS